MSQFGVEPRELFRAAKALDVNFENVKRDVGTVDSELVMPGNAWVSEASNAHTHFWDVLDKHREAIKAQLAHLAEMLYVAANSFTGTDEESAQKQENLMSGLETGGLNMQ
ncbi:hypothetical protein ACFVAV_07535 [Nocardia sp. NPDC057663]|uniref:hypothetical protein n=1 Tax=Nocardia sp. NPDC057663 TaxID=3346201 RepID=UPI00366A583A